MAKPSKKNIAAFKALVERYETITLKELKELYHHKTDWFYSLRNVATGFGRYNTCTLCKAVEKEAFDFGVSCSKCVYGSDEACGKGVNAKSFNAICNSDTPAPLFKAYRKRAEHLRKTYSQYL